MTVDFSIELVYTEAHNQEVYDMTENALTGTFLVFYSAVCFMLAINGLKHHGPKLLAFSIGALSIPLAIYFFSNV